VIPGRGRSLLKSPATIGNRSCIGWDSINIKEENLWRSFYGVIIIGSGPPDLPPPLSRQGRPEGVLLEKGFRRRLIRQIAHIENYPGYETINGMDLTKIMAKQAEKFGRNHHLSC